MPKYITPVELAEMKARGYEAATIGAAEAGMQRWQEAQAVCQVIEEAFFGVKLGNGVGLKQAQGLDDYADETTLTDLRAMDEKENWQRIPAEALSACASSLSFFDAEGMKFHLPAYLIVDLRGLYQGTGMAFTLTYYLEGRQQVFALLDPVQRRAVRSFLLFIAKDEDYEFERPDIRRALRECWVEPSTGAEPSERGI